MHSLSASKAARMFRWPVASVAIAAGVVIALAAGASGSTSPRPGPTGASGGRSGPAAGAQALTWSLVPSPNPASEPNSVLTAVSCVSAAACTAVGAETDGSEIGKTLIESWNGTTWSVVPSPNAARARLSFLTGVSCASAATCTAVGYYFSTPGADRTLIESWNGTTWTVVPSPSRGNSLTDVSCVSAAACTAVGSYTTGNAYKTLIESWNGTTWTVVPSPNPGAGYLYHLLNGVSCVSTAACTAVGNDSTGSGSPSRTLIESWNGTSWSVMPSAQPGENNYLNGTSCIAAPAACTAVGSDLKSGSPARTTLIETRNGTTWSVVPSPNRGHRNWDSLYGVSCVSATACTAVGAYQDRPVNRTLIESWDGTSWSVVPSPNRGPVSYINDLNGVSCASAAACTAVGSYTNNSGAQRTLIESGTLPVGSARS